MFQYLCDTACSPTRGCLTCNTECQNSCGLPGECKATGGIGCKTSPLCSGGCTFIDPMECKDPTPVCVCGTLSTNCGDGIDNGDGDGLKDGEDLSCQCGGPNEIGGCSSEGDPCTSGGKDCAAGLACIEKNPGEFMCVTP